MSNEMKYANHNENRTNQVKRVSRKKWKEWASKIGKKGLVNSPRAIRALQELNNPYVLTTKFALVKPKSLELAKQLRRTK